MLENQIPSTPVLIKDLGMKLGKNISSKEMFRFGIYRCSCGKEFETRVKSVESGRTKSCGCYKLKLLTSHGMYGQKYIVIMPV